LSGQRGGKVDPLAIQADLRLQVRRILVWDGGHKGEAGHTARSRDKYAKKEAGSSAVPAF